MYIYIEETVQSPGPIEMKSNIVYGVPTTAAVGQAVGVLAEELDSEGLTVKMKQNAVYGMLNGLIDDSYENVDPDVQL